MRSSVMGRARFSVIAIVALAVSTLSWMAPSEAATDSVVLRVQAEIAAHPTWPQRPVTVHDGGVWVAFSPGDPADYRSWIEGLPTRFAGSVRGGIDYVADPGEPSLARLQDISAAVNAKLSPLAQAAHTSLAVSMSPLDGAVRITYGPTIDEPFALALAKTKTLYGSLVQIANDPVDTKVLVRPAGASVQSSSLSTKGGYRITLWDGTSNYVQRCTLGFNVVKNGVFHFLTAAHCIFGSDTASPYAYYGVSNADSNYLGTNAATPLLPGSPRGGGDGGDVAIIRYSSTSSIDAYGVVYAYGPNSSISTVDILGSKVGGEAQWACTFGATTAVKQCGPISDNCAYVTYPSGDTLRCVLAVPIVSKLGDSGAPLWVSGGTPSTGYGTGILSGGNSTTSYYTDLYRAEQKWGASAF